MAEIADRVFVRRYDLYEPVDQNAASLSAWTG